MAADEKRENQSERIFSEVQSRGGFTSKFNSLVIDFVYDVSSTCRNHAGLKSVSQ